MSIVQTTYWHKLENNKIQCDLCPRFCKLSQSQRGLCYVRGNQNDEVVLYTYGRSSGFCVDPIEKKPLNHFFPGSAVLSFGTAGCNLSCKFCQNWDISKSRQMDTLQSEASPLEIVNAAIEYQCQSIAFTYNDPVIFLEYAKDVALEARAKNIKTVAVTAGYISDAAREEFFSFIDAANVDLKSFSEVFYQQMTSAHLRPVLDSLVYLVTKTSVWTEITTLLIPGMNDSESEITKMCQWIREYLGDSVPLHFSAFHPDYKLRNVRPTSPYDLNQARQIALSCGLKFVYTGNVHDKNGSSTYCPKCKNILIGRDWFSLSDWNLGDSGQCKYCQYKVPGHFAKTPGTWKGKSRAISLN